MVAIVIPNGFGYSDGVFFLNFSSKSQNVTADYVNTDYHFCLIFDDFAIYMNMLNKSFGVKDKLGFHGTYMTIEQAVTTHCFGKVDNLIYFFNNYVFNDALAMYYTVRYGDLIYSPSTHHIEAGTSATVRELKELFSELKEWDYTSLPQLQLTDEVISKFLGSLDHLFNEGNFPSSYRDNDYMAYGRVPENQVRVFTNNKGNSFLAINFQEHRHFSFFVPYLEGETADFFDDTDTDKTLNDMREGLSLKLVDDPVQRELLNELYEIIGLEETESQLDTIAGVMTNRTDMFDDLICVFNHPVKPWVAYLVFKDPKGELKMANIHLGTRAVTFMSNLTISQMQSDFEATGYKLSFINSSNTFAISKDSVTDANTILYSLGLSTFIIDYNNRTLARDSWDNPVSLTLMEAVLNRKGY